jgi:Spy/CpxP family protein refolding chaperone
MRRLVVISLGLLIACSWIYVASKAQAQERQGAREMVIVERIQDLGLSDEQESKIADIRKEWRPKVEAAAKQLSGILREEEEKVKDVLTVEQLDEIHQMREMRAERRPERLAERLAHVESLELTQAEAAKIEAIRAEFRPKIAQALEGLKGTLSEEQKNARDEALKAGKRHAEIISALNLTAEQKEKVEAAGKEVGTLVRQELEQIKDVLTPEQQEKVGEAREERRDQAHDRFASAVANAKSLNLTDDQKSRLKEIRQEYKDKVHEAAKNLRAPVRDEVAEIITIIQR